MMKRWSGYEFRYSGMFVPPYYFFNSELNMGDGIIGSEIMTICRGLNLTCRRVEPADGLMGQIQVHENGTIKSISGILKELYNNQTDIGAGAYWLSNGIYDKLVVPPVVRMSNFFLVTGMKKAYVTQPVNVALAYDVMAVMVVLSPTRRVQTVDDMFKYNIKSIYPGDTEYYPAVMSLSGSNPKVKSLLDTGYPVSSPELLSEKSRRLLVEGKGGILTMEHMILFQCSIWCKTTNDFYYMSPALPKFSTVALISSMNPHLPKDLLHDYTMSVLWLFATGHQFLPDDITFKSRFDCMPDAKNKQLDTAQAFVIRDLKGIFLIWGVTVGISIFGFILELFYYYAKSFCCNTRRYNNY